MVIVLGVHTDHIGGDISALGGGGDDYLLGTGLQVLASPRAINEHTGSLNQNNRTSAWQFLEKRVSGQGLQ